MKSGDEIKKGLECCVDGNIVCAGNCTFDDDVKLGYPDCVKLLMTNALALIQHLEAQVPRWISVEERLPERGTWVLCCGAKGGLFLSDWLIPHNINTNDNTVYCSVPNARSGRYAKYWMPLPEPPKEVTP